MNWADAVIILAILLFTLRGYFTGFIRLLADFFVLILAIILASRFYASFGAYITSHYHAPQNLSKIVAFVIIWVGVQFILNLVTHLLYPLIPEGIRKSLVNRIAGALPGFLWGVVFVAIFVTLVSVFPMQNKYKDAVVASKTGSFFIQKTNGFEGQVIRIFGGALNDTLTFLTVKPNSDEIIQLGFKTTDVTVNEPAENKMLELINKERVSRGKKPLVMDEKLREVARAHSRDMFARGYFAHTSPDGKDPFTRMKDAGIEFLVAGENLALAPNVELAHEGLMNSPGHRANILEDSFGKVGIGCIDGGKYGLMFSQEFTN